MKAIFLFFLLILIHSLQIVELISVQQNLEILVTQKFRNNDIMTTEKTKKVVIKEQEYKRMQEIPKIDVKIGGKIKRKYQTIDGRNYYVIRKLMNRQQLINYLTVQNKIEGLVNRVILSEQVIKQLGLSLNNSKICKYSSSLNQNQLREILTQCSTLQTPIKAQQSVSQEKLLPIKSQILAVLICLITWVAFQKIKLIFFFDNFFKRTSVV